MTKETSFESEIQSVIQAVIQALRAHVYFGRMETPESFSIKVILRWQSVRSENRKALVPVVFVQYLSSD